jgi:hypothetical protein
MWFRTGAGNGMFGITEQRLTIGVRVTHVHWKMSPASNYHAEYTSNGPRPPGITFHYSSIFYNPTPYGLSYRQCIYIYRTHNRYTSREGPYYWLIIALTQCINTTSTQWQLRLCNYVGVCSAANQTTLRLLRVTSAGSFQKSRDP